MFSFQEQVSAAAKSSLEAQIALMTAFTNKAFESVEKVIDLNMNVARASLEDSAASVQQLLSAKDAKEFLSLSAAQAQPTAEKVLAYNRHLAGIASNTQAEFTKAAEAQVAETSRKVIALVEELSKSAPVGTENAVALIKSAIGSATAGYEQLTKTTKQAVEAFESNINVATTQFAEAANKGNGRTSAKK